MNTPSPSELKNVQRLGADYRQALRTLASKTNDPTLKKALALADEAAMTVVRYMQAP
jgi:hypothetical protein